tara:strand:+ start:1619 stop:1759 length:141 start_codon:yes stop_codon:yes gene_type:complete
VRLLAQDGLESYMKDGQKSNFFFVVSKQAAWQKKKIKCWWSENREN